MGKVGEKMIANTSKEETLLNLIVLTRRVASPPPLAQGSDSEDEKLPRTRLRPRHVPGSLGLAPPLESALGKKLFAGAPSGSRVECKEQKGGRRPTFVAHLELMGSR